MVMTDSCCGKAFCFPAGTRELVADGRIDGAKCRTFVEENFLGAAKDLRLGSQLSVRTVALNTQPKLQLNVLGLIIFL